MTELISHEYKPEGQAKMMLILLHGYGANGADLFGLKHFFKSRLGEDIIILAPDAPQICEIDMGEGYRQWFSLLERTPEALLQGAQSAYPILKSYIEEQLKKYDIPAQKLVIAGFSQGCMMSLYTGLRLSEAPAAIVGWSGLYIADEGVKQHPPVQLWHGTADEAITPDALGQAVSQLKRVSIEAENHMVTGMGHMIAPEVLEGSIQFILRHI